MSALIPDAAHRIEVFKALTNSIEVANAVGPGSWSVSLFRNLLRLNVGPIEVTVVGEGFVRLVTLEHALKPGVRRRLRGQISFDSTYSSVPGRKGSVNLEPERFAGAYSLARDAHEALCERAAVLRSRSSFRKAYSEGVLLMMEKVFHRKLPRPSFFSPPTHILVASNEDEFMLGAGANRGRTLRNWVVPRAARTGHAALFFSRKRGLIADGIVAASPAAGRRIGRRPAFRSSVANVRTWPEPIGLSGLRTIKGWPWLSYPRSFTTVPEAIRPTLWTLIRGRNGQARPGSLEAKAEAVLRSAGAGFGNSEENRKVERAAIAFVSRRLKKEGWTVRSVEQEKCGFDLKCSRGTACRNVEVKGVSGTKCEFVLTGNEWAKAQEDSKFFLYAVTSARSARPRLHALTAGDLSSRFELRAIAYKATPSA